MKIHIFIGIISVLLLGTYAEDRIWSKEEDDCVIELNLDKTVMQVLNKQSTTPENNSDFINFLGCYWEKRGRLNRVGEVNWQVIDDMFVKEFQNEYLKTPELTTVLAEEMVIHAASECRNANLYAHHHGETAARLRNCIKEKIQNAVDNFQKVRDLSNKLFDKLF